MRRPALVSGAVVLLLGFLLMVRPFIAEKRDYPAGVPSPAAVERADQLAVTPGETICMPYVAVDELSEQARFNVELSGGRPAGPLRFALRATDGSGYAFARDVPAVRRSGAVAVLLTPPTRPIEVEACIANRGSAPVLLLTATDRARSRSTARRGREDTGQSPWLSFFEVTPRAITERLPQTVQRATVFRPAYVSEGLLWVLLALLVTGVPAGLLWAVARGLSDDSPDEPLDLNRRRRPWGRFGP